MEPVFRPKFSFTLAELDTRGAVVATLELEAGVAEAGHGAPADLDAARPRDAVTLAHQLQGRLQRRATGEVVVQVHEGVGGELVQPLLRVDEFLGEPHAVRDVVRTSAPLELSFRVCMSDAVVAPTVWNFSR